MTIPSQIKTVIDQQLAALDGLLAKAAANGGDALLSAKLANDMASLAGQVRIACDQVSAGLKRLSDSKIMLPDEDDTTIAAARERVAKARAAASSQADASFVADDAPIEMKLPNGMNFAMRADEYARDWMIAQLYFHVVAAYMILRAKGLAVGKADFVGYIARYAKKPSAA